jgi:hypothetical protein
MKKSISGILFVMFEAAKAAEFHKELKNLF